MINHYTSIGGAEVFAQELAERFFLAGNEVDVITGVARKGKEYFETVSHIDIHRVKMLREKYNILLSTSSYTFSSALTILELNKNQNYSIIHSIANTHGTPEGA